MKKLLWFGLIMCLCCPAQALCYSLTSNLQPLTSKYQPPTSHLPPLTSKNQPPTSYFTFVQLNCENLFDCEHDSLRNDYEYLPTSAKKWDKNRYWKKINNIAREIIACGEGDNDTWALPDMVALCEIENDSVCRDLTRRSLLRQARYDYVMTESNDERGIDVALLYSPFSFQLLSHYPLRVNPVEGRHATRDVLYASGIVTSGDTLHVMVVHAPSRRSGAKQAEAYRMEVMRRVMFSVDSIRALSPDAHIVVAGDFNAYDNENPLQYLTDCGLTDASSGAQGQNGARGTYKYMGEWGSLDHIFLSAPLLDHVHDCRIADFPFLLEDDKRYGGLRPRRTYIGPRYQKSGFSDHLPLVLRLNL